MPNTINAKRPTPIGVQRVVGLYCLATGCDWNDRERHCMDADRAATCPRKFTRNPKPKRDPLDDTCHGCAGLMMSKRCDCVKSNTKQPLVGASELEGK